MRKILPFFIVGILVLSGLGAVASHNEKNEKTTEIITVAFSPPAMEDSDSQYVKVCLEDTTSYLMNPGQPMIPKVVKAVELPFGVRIVKVDVIPKTIQECKITKEICPAPAHVPLIAEMDNIVVNFEKDEKVYASTEFFPSTWYKYHVGCGLNSANKWVTHVIIDIFPTRYIPAESKLYAAESADIKITYEKPELNSLPTTSEYDLVIIAPSKFTGYLQKLVDHKNSFGVNTILKTTEEIYDEYSGVDKPEQIKYFIKDAIETWGIKYVLLVGGLKSLIWAKSRDDANQGSKYWHVPVRYTNCFDNPEHPLSSESLHDPGVISDLYYADIYREGGIFEDWDPNDDGFFAAWGHPGVENDTDIDFLPDVNVGRLACRNGLEVKTLVDKIIKYEEKPADPSWFKKVVVISGDGFLDQEDLDIQWDTNSLPYGEYTIYAQSINPDAVAGPIDTIHVTLDRSVESYITFNHDDHLKTDSYPFPPITDITSPSDGDILGNTNYYYEPTDGEAYCNDFNGWANVEYENGIMHIRGKSYDPQPYGNITNVHVWIKNEEEHIVFSAWRNNTEMYYEGEWITGEKLLKGGGGALYYMPEDFEKDIIWASNGKLTGQKDVIEALSQGCGFAFLSGHGSPNVWANHYPGVPGNRRYGSVTGLKVIGIKPYLRFVDLPIFPMNKIRNEDKLPIVLIGGCHNSQFNVSMLPAFIDVFNKRSMWTHGNPVPKCFSWYLTKLPGRGAIATIGNTGLGYGTLGKDCNIGGLDGGICIEFFRQYGEEGHHVLGDAYSQTLTEYVKRFGMDNQDHAKTLQQWVLLGDPSLMIGGYS